MTELIKVAVATKDGKAIDEHFGHAKRFKIYEIGGGNSSFLEDREVPHYCLGGHSDKSAMPRILDTIQDCKAVFVARVGDGPREKLANRGIEAIDDYPWSEIEPALLDYAKIIS